MKYHFTGELKLKDNLNIEYFIFNKNKNESNNITEILDKVYNYSPTLHLKIIIKQLNNLHKNKQGILHIYKDQYGVDSYHLKLKENVNYPLELELFNLVGQEVEIFIDDYLPLDREEAIYEKRKN